MSSYQSEYPPHQFPPGQSPPPTAPRPTKSRALGDRLPWSGQLLVSIGITVFMFVLNVATVYLLGLATDKGRWVSFSVFWLLFLVYAVIYTIWSRSLLRGAIAFIVGFGLYSLNRLLGVPYRLDWHDVVESDFWYHTMPYVSSTLFSAAIILGWTIARRRTAYTWIGLLPGIAWIGFSTWMFLDVIHFGSEGFVGALGSVAIDFAFILPGIFIFWACDGIGMVLAQSKETAAPAAGPPMNPPVWPGQPHAPSTPPPGAGPYPPHDPRHGQA